MYFDKWGNTITARVSPESKIAYKDKAKIVFDMDKVHVFDKDTEMSI